MTLGIHPYAPDCGWNDFMHLTPLCRLVGTATGWVFRKPSDPPLANPAGKGSFPCDVSRATPGRGHRRLQTLSLLSPFFLLQACIPDPYNGATSIRDLYDLAGAPPGTRFTVPVLWCTKTKTIVNNEVKRWLAG
jgi:glutathionyl-hydroquinone reductase